MIRRWLARLSFSFLVLAVVFAWEGHRSSTGERGPEKKGNAPALYLAAALALGAGLAGIRERHRG